jgi:hypothetical protein
MVSVCVPTTEKSLEEKVRIGESVLVEIVHRLGLLHYLVR